MTDRIFEIGEAGLETTDQRVKKLMDNIVNAQVPGYKKSEAVISGFPLELERASNKLASYRPQVDDSFYSDIAGALVKTDSKLDLALGSDGYFIVLGAWGEGFTRDGRFRLDKDGRLVSVAGSLPIMGKSGPIIVPPGADVEFTQNGEVKVDGVIVDSLRVVMPENKNNLTLLSGSVFKKKDDNDVMQEVDSPRVIQGYIETSNVSVVDEMMEMILLNRLYSIDSKLISTRDSNLARAMELGRPTQ